MLGNHFTLQHRHYVNHFADADFLVLKRHAEPLGRLYLRRSAPEFPILDISPLRHVQGQGMGMRLISATQQLVTDSGCGAKLHVDRNNRSAQRLYRRLGVGSCDQESGAIHLQM